MLIQFVPDVTELVFETVLSGPTVGHRASYGGVPKMFRDEPCERMTFKDILLYLHLNQIPFPCVSRCLTLLAAC
jgi:hypothetical protein